jgi:hypothetical protein
MMNPDELRQKAAQLRLMALQGGDIHLVAALRQLAEEFDLEAMEADRKQNIPEQEVA